jgi:hypothetical protein
VRAKYEQSAEFPLLSQLVINGINSKLRRYQPEIASSNVNEGGKQRVGFFFFHSPRDTFDAIRCGEGGGIDRT